MMDNPTRAVLVSVVPLMAFVVAGCSGGTTTEPSGTSAALCQTSGPAQEVAAPGWHVNSFTFAGTEAVVTAKASSSAAVLGGSAKVLVYLGPKSEPPTLYIAREPIKIEGATIELELANGQPTLESLPPGDYWAAPVPIARVTIQPCQGSSVSNIGVQPDVTSK